MIRDTNGSVQPTYPNLGKRFHHHNLMRSLYRSGAVKLLGHPTTNLIGFISLEEDRWQYSRWVAIWNAELRDILNYAKDTHLVECRRRAIEAGWMIYRRENDRSVGLYCTSIPNGIAIDLGINPENGMVPENGHDEGVQRGYQKGVQRGQPSYQEPKSPKTPKNRESAAVAAGPLLNEVLDVWNSIMGQGCRLTPSRSAALKLRLADSWWCGNWRSAIAKADASAFCRGQNDKGWRMDFEFFIRPDSVTKLLEGKYDNKPLNGTRHELNGWSDEAIDALPDLTPTGSGVRR